MLLKIILCIFPDFGNVVYDSYHFQLLRHQNRPDGHRYLRSGLPGGVVFCCMLQGKFQQLQIFLHSVQGN